MKANMLSIQLSALLPLTGGAGAASALLVDRSKLAVGNFTQTCTDVVLAGYNLNATCATVAGAESEGSSGDGAPADRQNMLNLPLCVGVDYKTMRLIFAY